ncbi:hypothetical protein NPIL_269621 [Nephila pilipes]|uniref:Uncharacterized protein n=1 Tax=Nephila pilipes TaxID=299642 RepID=A0A8X6PCZ8_NEPPI|nr:hypothetical protein NPIL_269621 [Nephila pilipes]
MDTNIASWLGTKQTARKKKNTESIDNSDPIELEIDTDEDESETMDTTDQDRNKEAGSLRTRMEEKYKEIKSQLRKLRTDGHAQPNQKQAFSPTLNQQPIGKQVLTRPPLSL